MAESDHKWVDSLLWALLPLSIIRYVSARQQDVGEVGEAQVQEVASPQNQSSAIHGRIAEQEPTLFAHWRAGMIGAFA